MIGEDWCISYVLAILPHDVNEMSSFMRGICDAVASVCHSVETMKENKNTLFSQKIAKLNPRIFVPDRQPKSLTHVAISLRPSKSRRIFCKSNNVSVISTPHHRRAKLSSFCLCEKINFFFNLNSYPCLNFKGM